MTRPLPTALPPLEADRIFYLHGFASHFDAGKPKLRALGALMPLEGVTVDYTRHRDQVFQAFARSLRDGPRYLLIGTSLGGYFAAWLGCALGLPFVAINPAIDPYHSLKRHLGHGMTYFGTSFELRKEVLQDYRGQTLRLDGQGEVFLDAGDDVIPPQDTIAHIAGRLPVTVFPGGSHRFDHVAELVAHLRARRDQPRLP